MTGNQDVLWNMAIGPAEYSAKSEKYQAAILEQYKLCVEMADHVSARRNLTNTFFLSLNTAVVAVLAGTAGHTAALASAWVLAAGLAILLAQCLMWFAAIRAYRQLNAAKYAVIGRLEERLPAFAYSKAEWGELEEGRDWRSYVRLTFLEQSVPVIFAAAYTTAFLAVAL